MSTTPHLFYLSTGEAVAIGEKLGEGGEGVVYQLATDPALLVKVYKRQMPGEHPAKLQAIVGLASPALLKVAAWPTDLVVDNDLQPCGFLMPRVPDAHRLTTLLSPVSRLRRWPERDFRFLVRVAGNLARLAATVHGEGVVIGDLNETNVLVTPAGLTFLVDCDSVQVIHEGVVYECPVGVGRYLAPELHEADLAVQQRTPTHDSFSLAVLIFQLVMMGRHPFAGVYKGEGDLDEAASIRRGLYAYSARVPDMDPPLGAPALDFLGPELVTLFERAFLDPHPPRGRPVPEEWIAALDRLEPELQRCRTHSSHYHPRHLTSCIWCELRGQLLFDYFPPAVGPLLDDSTLGRLLDPARHEPSPDLASLRRALDSIPSLKAKLIEPLVEKVRHAPTVHALRQRLNDFSRWSGLVLLDEWFNQLIGGPEGQRSMRIRVATDCIARIEAANQEFHRWHLGWEQHLDGLTEHVESLRRIATQKINAIPGWIDADDRRIDEVRRRLETSERWNAMDMYLAQFPVAASGLSLINPHRAGQLAGRGLLTAAHIDARSVSKGGLLPAEYQALMKWRLDLEDEFEYNPSPDLEQQAEQVVLEEFRRRQRAAVVQAIDAIKEVDMARRRAATEAATLEQEFMQIYPKLEQAWADWSAIEKGLV